MDISKECCRTCEYGIFEEGKEDGVCIYSELYIPLFVGRNHICEEFIRKTHRQCSGYLPNEDFYKNLVDNVAKVLNETLDGADVYGVAKAVVNRIFEVKDDTV